MCILSFTACLLKPQSILNFKGRFAFVSKSIPLVYTINCTQCGLQYTGETKRPVRNRMYEHYSSVQKFQAEKATPVSRHFTQKNHSVRNMEFSILQWMGDPSSPNATTRRRRQELYYIWAFPTLHPAGINMFV